MAGIIGLMPAMILGLTVQTLWAIAVAVAKGNFILVDFFFVLLLLALGGGLAWFNIRENILDSEAEQWIYYLIIVSVIGFYIRKRLKNN